MVAKLTRPGATQGQQTEAQPAQTQAAVVPKGWANRGGAQAQTQEPDQRDRIQEQINPEKAPAGRGAGFSRRVQETSEALQQGGEQQQDTHNGVRTDAPDPVAPDKPRRTRGAAASAVEVAPAAPPQIFMQDPGAMLVLARAKILGIAFADPACELQDGLDIADELWKWASDVKAF